MTYLNMTLPKKDVRNEYGESGILAVFRGSQKYLGKL